MAHGVEQTSKARVFPPGTHYSVDLTEAMQIRLLA